MSPFAREQIVNGIALFRIGLGTDEPGRLVDGQVNFTLNLNRLAIKSDSVRVGINLRP